MSMTETADYHVSSISPSAGPIYVGSQKMGPITNKTSKAKRCNGIPEPTRAVLGPNGVTTPKRKSAKRPHIRRRRGRGAIASRTLIPASTTTSADICPINLVPRQDFFESGE